MNILIDYDNLSRFARCRGVRYVISSLLGRLGSEHIAEATSINCRLYGGWFLGSLSSPTAERLLPEIRRDFPCAMPLIDDRRLRKVRVRAELARSLVCDPVVPLSHTYRPRSLPRNLSCATPPFRGCVAPSDCPIAPLRHFLHKRECSVENCYVRPDTVLSRGEQKLVDSMLIVDLVHYAQTTTQPLVVVSGDDDFWPGIRFGLLRGARIIHAIPGRHKPNRNKFRLLKTETYSQVMV